MAQRIQQAPPRRRPTAIKANPTQAATPLDLNPPPITEGVDAVVGWINRLNLQTIDLAQHQPQKHKALQALVAAFGRCRATARDVALLLQAREQRDRIAAAGAYATEPPLDDGLAMPLWHAFELVRLIYLVAQALDVDKDDVAAIQTRIRHHVAGVTVREADATADFKRRHRIGSDVAGAVAGYAQIQAQLEKEALTAGDAEDARDDLIAFGHFMKSDYTSPWHVQVVCDALMRAERREVKGLIINMPPRRSKSTNATELFPAWLLGRHPTWDIIVGTHSQHFADSLGRKVRNMIQAAEYRRVFQSISVAQDSSAAAQFEIIDETASARQRRGNFKAFGRGGAPAGSGANCLILDDFLSEQDAYSATERAKLLDDIIAFRTRLAPDAIWIVINTRYHEDDVVGVVKRDFADDREWTVITLPEFAETDETWIVTSPATKRRPAERKVYTRKAGDVLWPDRFSAESSEQLKAALLKVAPHKWWGQFQCRPVPASGAMVDVSWFRRYDYADVMSIVKQAARVVVSVDCGGVKLHSRGSGAYGSRTAITVWAEWEDGRLYLIDVIASPWIYPDMIQAVKDACANWKPTDLLIENKAAGVELIRDLHEHRNWVQTPITPIDPFGPKETRMSVATPQIRAGQVFIPAQGACADIAAVRCAAPAWLEEFLTEMGHFPMGSRNDITDSSSQMLNWRRDSPVWSNFSQVTASSPAKDALMAAIAGPFGRRGGVVKPTMRIGSVRR
jgi:predicted phage terminase large subunit-like protein